jgi:SAM-dependent methyltransferase
MQIVTQDFSRTRRRLLAALALAPATGLARAVSEIERTGGPFVPTPQVVVDAMLRLAKVGPSDFVVDLGSGDGIIVLTAAQKFRARGYGVDIDPELVKQSNSEAAKRGISDRARFHVQDVFKADLRRATVVTLYLLPSMMVALQPKLLAELRPGSRVVSHDYHFGDEWRPDEQLVLDVPEKELVNGVPKATVYLWIVPAKVAGRWQLRLAPPAGGELELVLRQRYQDFEGSAGGTRLVSPRLRGEEIAFALPVAAGRHQFRGRVAGDTMEGSVELAGGKASARWSAVRVAS